VDISFENENKGLNNKLLKDISVTKEVLQRCK